MKTAVRAQADQEPRHAPLAQGGRQPRAGAGFIDNRQDAITQRQLAESIHVSPVMVAQRQQLGRIFGSMAQLKGPEDEELQMKAAPDVLQRQGPEEEDKLLQGKFTPIQLVEDKELLQGKFQPVQREAGMDEEELLQGKFVDRAKPVQLRPEGSFTQQRKTKVATQVQFRRILPTTLVESQAEQDTLQATLDQPSQVQASTQLQRSLNQSPAVVQRAPGTPVQRIWKWMQIKTQPGRWQWVNPKDVGNKDEKPDFNGTTHGETYPKTEKIDVAAQAKQDKIKEYTPLIPHLAGELDGPKGVKGGHVWKMMEKTWGTRLQLVSGTPSQTESWDCVWTIDSRTEKRSTMFPADWDEATLREQLTNSSVISGKLYMGQIGVKKAGDTFYPG